MLFRTLVGDSIATMSHKDLKQLEARLDKGLVKIRARKVQCDNHIRLHCEENKYLFCLSDSWPSHYSAE
jgi:hypothetical protein